MSDLTLYKFCLRKIAINLRNGIYESGRDNLFKNLLNSSYVNDIMSAALDYQRANGFRVDDLEPLLKCGKLQELIISDINVPDIIPKLQVIVKVLYYLKSGCEKLKILHLPVIYHYDKFVVHKIRKAIGNVLKNSPELEEFNCCFSFNLKSLRNCRQMRRLILHFKPQQHWYEFLEIKDCHLQPHNCLEVFTVCLENVSKNVPREDIAVILRHCPQINSLGFIESSRVLSHLHGTLTSNLKLRHCYWDDSLDNNSHRIVEAVTKYPNIEELDFNGCRSRSIRCLRNLRNLVYLNISLHARVSSDAFNGALEVIGPRFKHFSLKTDHPMDISLLLKNCPNLESLKISDSYFEEFANPSVSLPNLQRLTLTEIVAEEIQIFLLLRDCNKLTELFLINFYCFDDETLHHFLQNNSLLNLKVAYLFASKLTERGFRKLLESAPQLEKLNIFALFFNEEELRRIISETGHGVLLLSDVISLINDEFFDERRKRYGC